MQEGDIQPLYSSDKNNRMETRGIEHLFDFQRFPNDGLLLLLLLLYAPVGLCLMLLRIFIGVHVFLVSCALPDSLIRRFIVRVMCSVLGMYVKRSSPRLQDRNARLYICNHVTLFDHNILNLLTSCNTPMLQGSPGFVCWARGFMEFATATGRAELTEALKRYCSTPDVPPLLLFPEEDTTNGRAGLLKFSSWPFSLADSIQPVALLVKRPLVAVSAVDSSWVAELLWTLFVPFTVYQVRWLPPVSRQDGESPQEFADKVQELLAIELGVVSTQFTKADKAEHIKRKRHVAPRTTNSNLGARPRTSPQGSTAPGPGMEDRRIASMAQQVKEVLPDIPLSVITRDLVRTNCVDTTITNLLEHSEETLLESPSGTPSGPSRGHPAPPAPAPATSAIKPSANTFGKSPIDRHMSLKERKEALYEYARRRYIEKHGLNQETAP
ncbi:lipid droplet-regulating VLDL assembly factor AUP1 isoform X2 [Megalops cyprinoides]|uniref:lipid droplet-regulating VLDL assembly factor AUP1 isoform X2 n=1 Tax=Megalops cyprinoides TaxID=118141 RepID=UPI0018645D68|nr:lipid droplet-regulating VLDL assembly factor AUP1 isoform X2 [Megalops cyprinoides]